MRCFENKYLTCTSQRACILRTYKKAVTPKKCFMRQPTVDQRCNRQNLTETIKSASYLVRKKQGSKKNNNLNGKTEWTKKKMSFQ